MEPRTKQLAFHFQDDAGGNIQNELDVDASLATWAKLVKALPGDSAVRANLSETRGVVGSKWAFRGWIARR